MTVNTEKLKGAIEKPPVFQRGLTISGLMNTVEVRSRLEDVLGRKAPSFVSSVISAVNTNPLLKAVDPQSVLSAAMVAATLDLPINPSLGFAHIVPYGGKAQFQAGWRAFVQLAMRSAQYKTLNVAKVYDGQLKSHDPFKGHMEFDAAGKVSENVTGYVLYFSLLNGFEKYFYMTREEVEVHGKRYSKSYGSDQGQWKNNFDAMALKTVIKLGLSKYGILSIEMQKAITFDQAVVHDDKPEYVDSTVVTEENVEPKA